VASFFGLFVLCSRRANGKSPGFWRTFVRGEQYCRFSPDAAESLPPRPVTAAGGIN
jgi:hypothetical protein